jgi:hypothetical protein
MQQGSLHCLIQQMGVLEHVEPITKLGVKVLVSVASHAVQELFEFYVIREAEVSR